MNGIQPSHFSFSNFINSTSGLKEPKEGSYCTKLSRIARKTMKIFLTLWRMFVRRAADARRRDECAFSGEPLDHPAIRRMSALELADLPFNRACCAERR
jgi:hypothetical protein